ncbi:carbamoyltransferase [Candidatus Woesearchaeota archaeon]|nr:carbamoyltransferase [Candidatus Woesearchaeota archaeon]
MSAEENQVVLGISCFYHDAAACLMKDGIVVAAAEEERFTRKKHDISFPINAINYCLQEGSLNAGQIDYMAFYEKPLLKFERLLSQHLEMFPFSFWPFYKALPSWLNEKLRVPTIIRKKLKYNGDILFIEHHMAHAASAFLVSPYEEAAILTIDGVGEWATASYGYGKGNEITLLKELRFPNSVGLLYSTVTAHLGFSVNNSEYKVMGLSPYGKPTYYDNFRKIIDVKEDGSIEFDMDYFDYHHKLTMPGKKFVEEFGPIRKPSEEVAQRHKDIAASLQKITEEIIFKMLNRLYNETKMENLCMAGGVALNSVANGKITKNTPFKSVWVQPAASDAGASLGAAAYAYNVIFGNKRKYVMESAYLGPSFSGDYIKNFLDKNNIVYKTFKSKDALVKLTANLIFNNNVVGWFQGRMEWGPRALGARSILSNAANPDMKDILNRKVKHREHFRPFAPVISKEDVHEYFEIDKDEEPFMLFVYPFKESKKKLVPGVVHVDGTGRLQTTSKEENELYYGVIKEFEKLSGIPILINTSFNIRGEPIVCAPEDAYKCMLGTGIDYLVIGSFLIKRDDNPKDMWDSEKIAKD